MLKIKRLPNADDGSRQWRFEFKPIYALVIIIAIIAAYRYF